MENVEKMDLSELEEINGGISCANCARACVTAGAVAYGAGYASGEFWYNITHPFN
ncbi:Blp family class II bacteriocin [Clostridium botulinum]|uniref:Bacteriocin n=1 Tax=Clostridium botulinum (strain Langeland / NCTC 10281 / Type F) TaxID=441772 RepID=A7GJP9_CLOBL|nr:class IIb bacteriocin, lactobin A/cerein 7B family [Clostridium botulinum]ABS42946.1 hypothetical protein CLI_A0005 [Clostridium botulinum F str. Langeland]ADG01361.1 hypothetical protein CBF_P0005 [Clostridium botulinum F str. 230613]MBY6794617.1 class IIb bacteriocin, lactobin A/cerein 7B family [Clostridium botulinum]MBY6939365.1 class IIb bacteriocin, lactobin A/cerein 7B family [Clostridium botulinum]MBY6946512.1 class IIb bacteriocin, lactobin A/cerein 7B family [Clostridium botulinum